MRKFLFTLLFILICTKAYAVGCDANTQILLHMEGADTSTTITDENCDASGAHTTTAVNDTQIDTAAFKWGASALLFDGGSDYTSTPDSTDWDGWGTTTGDYTVDYWFKPAELGTKEGLVFQNDGVSSWGMQFQTSDKVIFAISDTSTNANVTATTALTDNNWHHLALIKVGAASDWEIGIYQDGTQVAYLQSAETPTPAAVLWLGRNHGGNYFDGHIDEFRIQNNNYFVGTPNSTPDDTITTPVAAYAPLSSRGRLMITKFIKREDGKGFDRISYQQNFGWNGV